MKSFLFFIVFLVSQSSWSQKITVSGISSGAYMAHQFHIAHSANVSGAALVAGGPYYCSGGLVWNALKLCMETQLGLPSVRDSLDAADRMARLGKIDPVKNVKNSKVYVLAGTLDEVVDPRIGDVTVAFYKRLGVSDRRIILENKLEIGHAFPTENYGNDCHSPRRSPFISNCKRDGAGEILNHLYGKLKPKTQARDNRLFSFDQTAYFKWPGSLRLSLHNNGLIYFPSHCSLTGKQKCKIHVAFHGCKQTQDDIGTTYATQTGFNHWAEANNIIILYPQTRRDPMIGNPHGCWDWWGYSSYEFHTKNGAQIKIIAQIIDDLMNGELALK